MLLPLVLLASTLAFEQRPTIIGNSSGVRPAATAPAESTPAATTPANPAMTGDTQPNQGQAVRICRNERITGSTLPVRVCRNRFQSNAAQNEYREMLRRMQGSRTPDGI